MKNAEQIVQEEIHKFVNDNWGKIDKKKVGIIKTKKDFLKEIMDVTYTAMWVWSEVANWGMDKRYLEDWTIHNDEEDDFRVFCLQNKFIKVKYDTDTHDYILSLVKQKTKTITYFD